MRAQSRGIRVLLFSSCLVFLRSLSGADPSQPGEDPIPGAMTAPTPGASDDAPTAKPLSDWDVEAPRGTTSEARIDTRTGTWMSVDVSPYGRRLVFELLGDLYVLPLEGGEARTLTHGVAWDEQPRLSPDGRRIAFTSDCAGGDNVWVMDADSSHVRQVTWAV